MIIDVHTHYGVAGKWNMPIENQLYGMEKYGIDYAIISNIECGVFNKCIEGNRQMIEIARRYPDKFACLFWCCEDLAKEEKAEFEQLYLDNKDLVKGLKIHPDISHKRADDDCFDFFYALAEKYSIPVNIHTKNNEFSAIKYVVNAAKKFPKVNIVMAHMDIDSDDCEEALEAVKNYDNLYGDTSWVKYSAIVRADELGIVHKMMFGTDSPITSRDCYDDDYYKPYYSSNAPFINDVMCENAKRIYSLNF